MKLKTLIKSVKLPFNSKRTKQSRLSQKVALKSQNLINPRRRSDQKGFKSSQKVLNYIKPFIYNS